METNIWIPDDDDVSGPSRDRAKKRLRKYFLAQRVAWVRDAGFAWWLTITCVCGMLMASSVIAIELTTLHSRRHEAKERATLDQPVPLRGAPPPGGTPRPPSRAGPLDRQAPHELMRGAQASVPLPPLGDTDPETDAVMRQRRDAVRDAFRHAWRSYRAYAWGHDELRPVSNRTNDSWGGFGITVVDALDTLWIMGLRAEWREAREHVRRLSYRKDTTVSVFETTIRHMGGLLAAYTLSRDALFLQKAEDLAKLLLPAFNTPYRIPYHSLNLQTQEGHHPSWNSNSALLAEAGSVQLEWKYLSKLTGNAVYHDTVDAFMAMLVDVDAAHFENKTLSKYPEWGHWDRANAVRGLWPVTINPETAEFNSDTVSFGGMADSFYEYLLKQYVLSAKSDKRLLKMYEHAIAGMQDKLWGYSQPNRHAFIGEIKQGHKVADMEHLACFVPGLLALGGGIGVGTKARNGKTHLQMAKELLETCYATYEASPTGLGPEAVRFNTYDAGTRGDWEVQSAKYLLRPETVESLFILWRTTKDAKYRERAWAIFQSIEKHCKTPLAYSGVRDVTKDVGGGANWNDSVQSFFFAETLKYLYLIFSSDSTIPLDKYVFSTEAHPFLI